MRLPIHILQHVLNTAWALPESNMQQVVDIVLRNQFDVEAAQTIREERAQEVRADGFDIMPGARTGLMVNAEGIAILPISGPLFKKASFMAEVSGAASVDMMMDDFRLAMNNSAVGKILLDIDSPGGQVGGIEEFANLIYSARGVKDVVCYVSNMATSGGNWLASGAKTIIAPRSAILGSIGVAAAFVDTKKLEEKMGIEEITILSSNASKKRPDPATPEGASQIQATLNDIETVFISNMALHYGVSPDHVIAHYGQGDIMTGDRALEAGLIHKIGFREDAIAELQSSLPGKSKSVSAKSKQGDVKMDNQNPEVTAETTPVAVAPVVAAPVAQAPVAVTAQHTRIAGYFVAQAAVEARVMPESREALIPLHAAAQAAGFDTQLETFVLGLKPTALTTDVIPAATAAASKVLTEGKNGQAPVASTDAPVIDAETAAADFDGEAFVGSYIGKANATRAA